MSETTERASVADVDKDTSLARQEEKDLCRGTWKLRPGIVMRVEEDGAILFDPDTDAMSVVNPTASALLQWNSGRICYEEWCEALYVHYNKEPKLDQIRADVQKFLGAIAHFVEPIDGRSN